jgi:hypothetical protein
MLGSPLFTNGSIMLLAMHCHNCGQLINLLLLFLLANSLLLLKDLLFVTGPPRFSHALNPSIKLIRLMLWRWGFNYHHMDVDILCHLLVILNHMVNQEVTIF